MAKHNRAQFKLKDIHRYLDSIIGEDLHAKRVLSLAGATLGVMNSASLAIHAIGQGLAQARGTLKKHGVKQVDRLLSNQGIDVWAMFEHWVPHVVAASQRIVVGYRSNKRPFPQIWAVSPAGQTAVKLPGDVLSAGIPG